MKIKHILLLGIVGILGLGFSNASFSVSGVYYEDGIYRSQDRGLITVITGTNIATLQDKNLGATVLYNGTLTEKSNYFEFHATYGQNIISSDCSMIGNLYQFGNNYGFDCSLVASGYYDNSIVDLTTGIVYTDNYSSSSLFFNRDGHDISNAWGGLTATPVAQQGPCPDGFYVPNSTDFQNFSNMLSQFDFLTANTRDYYKGNAVAYFLKLPTAGYNGNWTNSISSISLLDSNGNFNYLLSASFNNSLNRVTFGNSSSYVIIASSAYSATNVKLSPIRCFKNTPVLPNNSWVTLTGGDASILPEPEPDEPNQVGYVVPDGSIFDINTYLIEQAVKCYMSSGTIGVCDGINYTGYIESLGTSSVLWFPDEQRGYLEFYDAKSVLTQYCYNSNMISYAFCSQLDIYEGVDLLYYYESGVLDFYMLGSGFGISAESLGSGQIGSIACQGAWCNGNVSTGLTEYIIPVGSSGFDYTGNINYYDGVFSGNLLSGEYFKDLFFNHLFFDCPYQYKDNAFVIGAPIINLLGGRDVLYPINCVIAGYQEGYRSSVFGSIENILPWDGPLLSSDSDGFKKLYLLFDIILSFGIALLFIKLFSSHSH